MTDMTKDKYKVQFADAVSAASRNLFPDAHKAMGDKELFDSETLYGSLVKPKDASMGRFAFPVFKYAGLLKSKPPEIASKIADEANRILDRSDTASIIRVVAAGGFLNGQVDTSVLTRETLKAVLIGENAYGSSELGKDKTYLVEYSSPNIAKPFGVMHLRSTVLGNSLRRIYKKLGYTTVGINYPGDWGTQFGKMIVAYQKWGTEKDLKGEAVKNLLALYVRFHDEAKTDNSLEDQAREAFKKLEQGDPECVRLWQLFKDVSHAEFDRVYGLLGVEFDWVYGESKLNDKMEPVIQRLEKAGLTEISEGALVVKLPDENLPPVLLRRGDGATLYATRDLAGMVYRWEEYPLFHESLYIVNVAQTDHFKQCMNVIAMLEDAERAPSDHRMSGRMKHVDFGWLRFGDQTMSTRGGNIVLLEEVIDKAAELAREKIVEKNPDLKKIDETAHIIGLGAVIFSQLSLRRQRDIDFQWDEVLSFEGETGPYLQYTHARLCSLMRKYDRPVPVDVDFSLLSGDEEQRVIELLADFPKVIQDAGEQYEPFFISTHLLRLAAAFNKVYQRKDEEGSIDKIISDNDTLTGARIALVKAVQLVINEGLYLLGLEAPEEM